MKGHQLFTRSIGLALLVMVPALAGCVGPSQPSDQAGAGQRPSLAQIIFGTPVGSGGPTDDPEAMRKRLRELGVPPEEEARILAQLEAKMREGGAPQADIDAVMLQRRRPVIVRVAWRMDVQRPGQLLLCPVGGSTRRDLFDCRYQVSARAAFPGEFWHYPLPDTERLLRESQAAMMGILPASFSPYVRLFELKPVEDVSIAGGCTTRETRRPPCGFETDAIASGLKVEHGRLEAKVEMTDRGPRIFFEGTLARAEVRGTALGVVDAMDAVIDREAVQADYLAFLRELLQKGESRGRYRWAVPRDDGRATIDAEFHVQLPQGPVPDDVRPRPGQATNAPAGPAQ